MSQNIIISRLLLRIILASIRENVVKQFQSNFLFKKECRISLACVLLLGCCYFFSFKMNTIFVSSTQRLGNRFLCIFERSEMLKFLLQISDILDLKNAFNSIFFTIPLTKNLKNLATPLSIYRFLLHFCFPFLSYVMPMCLQFLSSNHDFFTCFNPEAPAYVFMIYLLQKNLQNIRRISILNYENAIFSDKKNTNYNLFPLSSNTPFFKKNKFVVFFVVGFEVCQIFQRLLYRDYLFSSEKGRKYVRTAPIKGESSVFFLFCLIHIDFL